MDQNKSKFTPVLLAICIFAALFAIMIKQKNNPPRTNGPGIGAAAIPFEVNDWINGKSSDFKDLKGKVYVLNAWGLRCIYCRKFAPVLVKAHENFKDKGVEFIGMTAFPKSLEKDLTHHLEEMKITWPNGIGAEQFMIDYEVHGIPDVWVVDKTGKIVWRYGTSTEPIEEAIGEALAAN